MTVMSNGVLETVTNAFNFSVDKFPLYGPDNMPTDQYGLFRSDKGYIKGIKSVSDRYVPHTTDDVLALTEAASEAFDENVEVKCHFRQGHYVAIAPTDDHRRAITGTVEGVFPRFMVRAGLDGRAFNATIGYYRDLCRNLSMLRTVSETSVAIRHTSGLRSQMDDLIETFQTLKGSWDDLTAAIDSMRNRDVVMTDFLTAIYGEPDPASPRAVTVHENRTRKIFDRLYREYSTTKAQAFPADFKVDAWLAYNAVQGYVQHDATRKTGFTGEFDRILLANNDQAVRRAEKLALGLSV